MSNEIIAIFLLLLQVILIGPNDQIIFTSNFGLPIFFMIGYVVIRYIVFKKKSSMSVCCYISRVVTFRNVFKAYIDF